MNISEYNQFLYVNARPVLWQTHVTDSKIKGDKDDESLYELEEKIKLEYSITVHQVDDKNMITEVVWQEKAHSKMIDCDIKKSNKIHTREELSYFCSKFSIFFEPELYVGNYRVEFKIINKSQIEKYFTGFEFEAYKINDGYSKFVVGLRYFFFMVSLFMAIGYCFNFSTSPVHLRVFE
jgi:Wnt-binding factor required for Wnt secretion